jgi:protoporphyrinogen oxidase
MSVVTDVDVAVLGGGPAGLAAAWYSARRGLSVAVLERADHVGGLAASIAVGGQRVDLGSHRLHPSIRPELLADLAALLGSELQLRKRNGRIHLDGRWVAFPLRPLDIARNASPLFASRVLADVVATPLRRRRHPLGNDFASAVRTHLGPTIANSFYEPYAVKLWGVQASELSAEVYRRRVSARSAAGVLRSVVRRGPPPSFWYPAGGFGRIAEVIADAVTSLGGTVEVDVDVQRITTHPDHVVIDCAGRSPIRARTVVSTIPGRSLATLAGAPDDVRDALAGLEHRGAVLVYLIVPRPRYTGFDAHYFPEPGVRIARLSEPKQYRDSPRDPSATTVLCAELPATVDDAIWEAPASELAEIVSDDLAVAKLPDPAPLAVHVERRAHVYPIYRLGFEAAQRALDAWIAGLDGVIAVGRQAMFAHDNTHHALAMGHAAAACLDRHGRVDRVAWQAARAAFAEHVVED